MTDLIGQFQRIFKFYTGILFKGLGPDVTHGQVLRQLLRVKLILKDADWAIDIEWEALNLPGTAAFAPSDGPLVRMSITAGVTVALGKQRRKSANEEVDVYELISSSKVDKLKMKLCQTS